MPELPEVEVFRSLALSKALQRPIMRVETLEEKLLEISANELEYHCMRRSFIGAERLGKYLFLRLEERGGLVFHFGMSGSLVMLKADENWDDYHYVRFTFQGGEGMAFRCPRKLGRLDWAESLESLRESKGLGPDALELDYESFQERLDQHRAPVKNLLLNQSILAGIGNWVADDALHLAGLHPAAPWQALDNEDRRRLFESLQKVLHIAIQSDADYARMPEEFLIHQRHKNGVSPRTGKPLEKMQVGGRSTYLCADTQPMPKEA